jgi:protein-disulfide isomerase
MMNDRDWVDGRMALLDSAEAATPDVTRAFARLQERDRRFRAVRRNWIWATAVASVACAVLVVMPSKSVCCARTPEETPAPTPTPIPTPAVQPPPAAAVVARPAAKKADPVVSAKNYKESGSASATVVCEIYSDFECPSCAVFYRDTYPQLESEYVKTGKVRILHRDFPLPQHRFAVPAARYSNAAGESGVYDAVFRRLFETQAEWGANGNIEGALAPVVSPELLARIRGLLAADPKIDESIALDKAAATADQINQTPTVVVVGPDGERHKIAGAQPFVTLSAYIDELLKDK